MKNAFVVLEGKHKPFLEMLDLFEELVTRSSMSVAIYNSNLQLLFMNDAYRSSQNQYFISNAWIEKYVVATLKVSEDIYIQNEWQTCDVHFTLLANEHVAVTIKPVPQIENDLPLYQRLLSTAQLDEPLIGKSNDINMLRLRASETQARTIAIFGQLGVGKRHVAKWLHRHHKAQSRYFIDVDGNDIAVTRYICEQLRDEKHPLRTMLGKYTLYVHHVEYLPFDVQLELVQLCQQLHAPSVIFSMQHCPQKSFENGDLCEALYEEIGEALYVPTLKERMKDIPLLISHFLKRTHRLKIEAEAIQLLSHIDWKRNVADLEQCVFDLSLADTAIITKDQVLAYLYHETNDEPLMSLAEAERALILKALNRYGYTLEGKKQTAEALKISLSTLYNKMKIYDL